MLEQLSIIPAGCQPWFHGKVVVNHQRRHGGEIYIAYCSTLSIHRIIYHESSTGGQVKFIDLITPFEQNIASIAWSPENEDLWVVSTVDQQIHFITWPLGSADYEVVTSMKTADVVTWMEFCPTNPTIFAYVEDMSKIRVMQVIYESGKVRTQSLLALVHENQVTSCQWHPQVSCRLFLGEAGGHVFYYDLVIQQGKLKQQKKHLDSCHFTATATASALNGPGSRVKTLVTVNNLSVDPHSDSYILVSYKEGPLLLCDTQQDRVITSFQSGTHVSSLEWVLPIPGGFVTADDRAGTLRLWSVSQHTPLETIRLISSHVHTITPVLPQRVSDNACPSAKNCFVMTFSDGSFGVYNIIKKKWLYLRQGGHTETIFACDMLRSPNPSTLEEIDVDAADPYNPLLLASASYDGTIKVWDLNLSTVYAPNNYFHDNNEQITMNLTAAQSKSTAGNQAKISELTNLPVYQNVGIYDTSGNGALKDIKTMPLNPSIDFSLLDSYPPLGAGRTNQDGSGMTTRHGIWYSASWASDGTFRLAAGSSRGDIVIYDAKHTKILGEYRNLHETAVFKVAWNPQPASMQGRTAGYILTASGDGFALVIRPENGSVFKRFKHPGEVFGCDWSPFQVDKFSTGCKDGRLYVWDASLPRDTPILSLAGHTERVFTTCWSPLVSSWIATASDDKDVRVWDIDQQRCIAHLKGHAKRTRGLVWHSEIPNILISGSWDSDLRVWDVDAGTCLSTIRGHAADVYGLTSVMAYPFLFVSSSRDNTMRLWTMENDMTGQRNTVLRYLMNKDFDTAVRVLKGEIEADDGKTFHLKGKMSRWLAGAIKSRKLDISRKLFAVMRFFSPLNGSDALWRLVANQLSNQPKLRIEYPLYHDGSSSILEAKDLIRYFELKAQAMESLQMLQQLQSQKLVIQTTKSEPTFLNPSSPLSPATRSELAKMRQAAMIRAKLGDLKSYCTTLYLLGEWDKALALAPAVSHEFWQHILQKYVQAHDPKRDSFEHRFASSTYENMVDMLVPYMIAAKEVEGCLNVLLDINDQDGAYLVASSFDQADQTVAKKALSSKEISDERAPRNLPPIEAVPNTKRTDSSSVTRLVSGNKWVDRIAQKIAKRHQDSIDSSSSSIASRFSRRLSAAWYLLTKRTDTIKEILGDDSNAEIIERLCKN